MLRNNLEILEFLEHYELWEFLELYELWGIFMNFKSITDRRKSAEGGFSVSQKNNVTVRTILSPA